MSDKKAAYPVILIPVKEGGSCVEVPDLEVHTQGEDIADALYMAKDAIEMMGVFLQDEGTPIPAPSDIGTIKTKAGEIKSLVAVDFNEYRRKMGKKLVKKTLSIPSWLNLEADAAGVNFSATLQDALTTKLGV
jgi:predicted RNase H-like HicB family nuclease